MKIDEVQKNIEDVKKSFDNGLKIYCTKNNCKKPSPDNPIPSPAKI